MASSMLNTFLSQQIFQPSQIIISETPERASQIRNSAEFQGCSIVSDNKLAASNSDILFLCVKPLAVPEVINEIKGVLNAKKQHLVSIAACVEIAAIEKFFKGRITRTLPTVISESGNGTTFITHNKSVCMASVIEIENILKSLGDVVPISENDYASAVNITSSAPGILAAIFDNYSHSAIRNTGIPKEVSDRLLLRTIFGTIKMLWENNISFRELTDKVATKGGITEASLNIIDVQLPPVFDSAVANAIAKDSEIKTLISEKIKTL